ncbi:MAG TPA: hypothetical protein VGD19_05770 [Allosphingosinicella sp.]|jgi:hypothetical protein
MRKPFSATIQPPETFHGRAKAVEKVRLITEELDELETAVGIAGSSQRQEVAGPVCIGFLVGLAIYANS